MSRDFQQSRSLTTRTGREDAGGRPGVQKTCWCVQRGSLRWRCQVDRPECLPEESPPYDRPDEGGEVRS
jgi:hypothetical protein